MRARDIFYKAAIGENQTGFKGLSATISPLRFYCHYYLNLKTVNLKSTAGLKGICWSGTIVAYFCLFLKKAHNLEFHSQQNIIDLHLLYYTAYRGDWT
jgi:hypothetical protein